MSSITKSAALLLLVPILYGEAFAQSPCPQGTILSVSCTVTFDNVFTGTYRTGEPFNILTTVIVSQAVTGAEDFSFYALEVPGLFFFLGGMPKGQSVIDAAPHHTPDFYIDESGFTLGMRALCNLTLDYMEQNAPD